jgi:hypothetical protein
MSTYISKSLAPKDYIGNYTQNMAIPRWLSSLLVLSFLMIAYMSMACHSEARIRMRPPFRKNKKPPQICGGCAFGVGKWDYIVGGNKFWHKEMMDNVWHVYKTIYFKWKDLYRDMISLNPMYTFVCYVLGKWLSWRMQGTYVSPVENMCLGE